MSDVLDIFAAPATQRFRKERPALVRARLAWAAQRVARARAGATAGLTCVQGVGVGDLVDVEAAPGVWVCGRVLEWTRGAPGEPLSSVTFARVRLAGGPPPILINRTRAKLRPVLPEACPA